MKEKVYNFEVGLDWNLLRIISQIDRFDASWSSIEKKKGQNLKQLKSIATIQSVGASTRIEGAELTDIEVEILLNNIDVTKVEDRDSQEVLGYSMVLDLITKNFEDIEIGKNSIQHLHNQLLKPSIKDEWHRGRYKQHTNAVEANFSDGTRQIIFETTAAGYPTEDAMRTLIEWYHKEKEVHPLIVVASFVYDFLSIHPFQDGNGRLSRLLTTLMLMKKGYYWIQYVSFEHEIEKNKQEYYESLRNCQAQRPNEDITDWINFFFNALINVQEKLSKKLEVKQDLSPKEMLVYTFINNQGACKTGEISKKLNMPVSSLKRVLKTLMAKELIVKNGRSAGTNYTVV